MAIRIRAPGLLKSSNSAQARYAAAKAKAYRRFYARYPKAPAQWRRYGLGATSVTVDPTQSQPAWLKTISDLAQAGLSIYQARQLQKIQLDRINTGKPPLSDSQIRALAPTVNVKADLPPEIKWPLIAGGAVILFLLVNRKR